MDREKILTVKEMLKAQGYEVSEEQIARMMSGKDAQLGRQPEEPGDRSPGEVYVDPGAEGGQAPEDVSASDGGKPGTWETAMMAVAKTVPSIMQAAQYRRPLAPASSPGGRRVMDIPSAGTIFGKEDPRFQSLLAMFLRGR